MKLHIDCRCGCSVLCIRKIFERTKEAGSQAVYYFNMYRSSEEGGLWYRLKCAWEYFRSGEFAYSDMTIGGKDIDRMVEFLNAAKNMKEESK